MKTMKRREGAKRSIKYLVNTTFDWDHSTGDVHVTVSTPNQKRRVRVRVADYDTVDDAIDAADAKLAAQLEAEGYNGK